MEHERFSLDEKISEASEDFYDDTDELEYEISAPMPTDVMTSLLEGEMEVDMPTPARARKNKFHPDQYLPAVVTMATSSSSSVDGDVTVQLLGNQLQMSSLSDLEEDDVNNSLMLRHDDNAWKTLLLRNIPSFLVVSKCFCCCMKQTKVLMKAARRKAF